MKQAMAWHFDDAIHFLAIPFDTVFPYCSARSGSSRKHMYIHEHPGRKEGGQELAY